MSDQRDLRPEPLLELDRDLPTTPEDVAALRRAREASERLSPSEYSDFLRALGKPSIEELRRRRGPHSEPFELP